MNDLAKTLEEMGWEDLALKSFFDVSNSFQIYDYNIVNFGLNLELTSTKFNMLCNFNLLDSRSI